MATRHVISLGAIAATLIFGSAATARPDDPELFMSVSLADVESWAAFVQGEAKGGGQYEYMDAYEDPFGLWDINFHSIYDSGVTSGNGGAGVFLTFALTNNTGQDETFTVVSSLPLLQTLVGITMDGDVEGTLSDADFLGGATMTDAGDAIYQGILDGNTELRLMDDPFSFSVPEFGGGTFGPFAASDVPGPMIAMTDIGIAITFTLSAGDSVSFTANFRAIPAPAALAMFGVAGLVGGRRRRRG